ncbi:hypothetical protein ABB27_17295 [Stenotrophomonas terrae]|uniref:Lipoprotein SmpA/OmlA domain-containing protein n=1 Tax=Stenotrophomonas terrae TaxID=405446 RepID=A0A0R0CCA5_9GAMM|nr:hypothetical protein ABB27_17295 [Stenotrophomonas terrae]
MHIRILQIFFLVTLTSYSSSAVSSPLLSSLAAELRAMRALPMATPTNARCPSDTAPLIGLSQNQLQVALGKPDFINKSDRSWTYFFTSPVPPHQFGGGYPELSFAIGTTKRVVNVTCHYSR